MTKSIEPFTRATFGGGGVPKGRKSRDVLDNPPGGRHAGALLQDPEQTLEKIEHDPAKGGADERPKGGADERPKGGVKRGDAKVP